MTCPHCGNHVLNCHLWCPKLSREHHARRLAEMAGVDENGGILPPTDEDLAAGIDRKPLTFWKNGAVK